MQNSMSGRGASLSNTKYEPKNSGNFYIIFGCFARDWIGVTKPFCLLTLVDQSIPRHFSRMQDETLISTRSIPMCLRYYFNWAPKNEKDLTLCPAKQKHAWAKGNQKNSKRENEQKIIEIGLCHAYFLFHKMFWKETPKTPTSSRSLLCLSQDFYSNEKNCLILWEPGWQRRDLYWHASMLGLSNIWTHSH